MKQFSYVLTKSAQPHARTVSGLMREIARFHSAVSVCSKGKETVVRKPRDILDLGLRCGDEIRVAVEGCDEEAAVAAIQGFVITEF